MNKVETKVELLFDVQASNHLDDAEKELIATRLSNRINKEGVLSVVSQASRSQLENKENTIELFQQLLEDALTPPKKRKKVRPLRAKREERLAEKKQVAEKKSQRQKVTFRKESDLCR